jgi:hypothetical protein
MIRGLSARNSVTRFDVGRVSGRLTRRGELGESSGATVDDRLKGLMKELGDAINTSLSDSEDIADVISRIKSGGYDVFLILEATIGFNRLEDNDRREPATVTATELESGDFRVTAQDVKFLESLRIRIDDGK